MEVVYHLNVFGDIYPEHGKKLYLSKVSIENRLRKYREEIFEKSSKNLSEHERSILMESIQFGYQITRIDTLICPQWKSLFKEKKFNKKKRNMRIEFVDITEEDNKKRKLKRIPRKPL